MAKRSAGEILAAAISSDAKGAPTTRSMGGTRIGTTLIVVISASFNVVVSAYSLPHWLGTVALIVMGAAIALFALQTPAVTRRIPWELRRKDPAAEVVSAFNARHARMRKELQRQFGAFNSLDKPTPAQLRASGHVMEQTLIANGYRTSAKIIEIHLPDNSDQAAVDKRQNELFLAVGRMLMWDEFQL